MRTSVSTASAGQRRWQRASPRSSTDGAAPLAPRKVGTRAAAARASPSQQRRRAAAAPSRSSSAVARQQRRRAAAAAPSSPRAAPHQMAALAAATVRTTTTTTRARHQRTRTRLPRPTTTADDAVDDNDKEANDEPEPEDEGERWRECVASRMRHAGKDAGVVCESGRAIRDSVAAHTESKVTLVHTLHVGGSGDLASAGRSNASHRPRPFTQTCWTRITAHLSLTRKETAASGHAELPDTTFRSARNSHPRWTASQSLRSLQWTVRRREPHCRARRPATWPSRPTTSLATASERCTSTTRRSRRLSERSARSSRCWPWRWCAPAATCSACRCWFAKQTTLRSRRIAR